MDFEQMKQYVDSIKDNEKFKEVLEFTRLTERKPDEDLYENIKDYLSFCHSRKDCKEWFQPDYEYFINFLEHYLQDNPAPEVPTDEGYLDLTKTPHLVKPLRFVASPGNFTDNHIMFTDGSKYVSKMPLTQKGNSGIRSGYCKYCALIASHIAKTIGVEAAQIKLAINHNGFKIMSKNFLRQNEELIEYADNQREESISVQLGQMEQALKLRRFSEEEIKTAKFEFLKQEFLAKIIGLRDQTSSNSPIIISVDETGIKHVRMAPMFDFDYSFHIGENAEQLVVRKSDNGRVDIGSLIEQYKDYPGFKEFVKQSIDSIDMARIFRRIYEETGIKMFEDYQNDEGLNKFVSFVNANVRTS